MRRVAAIVAALIPMLLVAPAPDGEAATRAISVTLTATVDFWDDFRKVGDPVNPAQRVDLWAPAAPPCGQGLCPGFTPNLDFVSSTIGSCVVEDTFSPVPKTCSTAYLRASLGTVLPPSLSGPWCGASWGNMELVVAVGATSYHFFGSGMGLSHIGTTMEWRGWNADAPGDLNNVAAAVAHVTGSDYVDAAGGVHDAACGLLAPEFLPTNRYDLAFQLIWNDPI